MLQRLIKLEKPFNFLRDGGTWFKIVLLISILIRLYLVLFTEGTYDVEIWEHHIEEIDRIGLIKYYEFSYGHARQFNHPPLISYIVKYIFSLSKYFSIPFKISFRLLFALLDFLTAFYLFNIFKSKPYRYLLIGFYLLCPLTFIMSAYHGNVDSSLGLFILMSLYYLSRKKYLIAGLIFGFGMSVKWIILLTAPTLFFSIPGFKNRMRFAVISSLTGILCYLSPILQAPSVVFNSVFKYGGQMIQTVIGIPVWGNRIIYMCIVKSYLKLFSYPTMEQFMGWRYYYLLHNQIIILVIIIVYAWFKKYRRSDLEIGKTIGEIFCIFYGLTNYWSFQYFAWAIPFLFFLNLKLAGVILFFTTGYIYLLYSLVCESYFLLGKWDFIGHPHLSGPVLFFRNASILLFSAYAIYLVCNSILEQFRRTRNVR